MRWECRERFPHHWLQKKPLVSDPGMHHGTCVTHVPWCVSGLLTSGGGENVPDIPGECATRNFTYLARGPWGLLQYSLRIPLKLILTHWGREKDAHHCTNDVFKRIFLNDNIWIMIKIPQKFVPKLPINSSPPPPLEKMTTISQTTYSNAFSWMKIFQFQVWCHWNMFLGIQLTICQH